MHITGKNFIGFDQSACGKVTFQTFNPNNETANEWLFTEATPEEVDAAVHLASEAFLPYQKCSGDNKALFLRNIVLELEKVKDHLLTIYGLESALSRPRAEIEFARTVEQLHAFAQLLEEGDWVEASIDTAITDRPSSPKADIRKMHIPLGPIVVFGASNFPLAYSTAGGDSISALAAGCPVLVKAHSLHAGTGNIVAQAIISAAQSSGMPNGVFSNLQGSGKKVGAQLVQHPLVKGVGFTGSIQGGRALVAHAAKRKEPIPVFAEMGSINPVVVLPSALKTDSVRWASTLAASITGSSGQFCTKPGIILGITGPLFSKFIVHLGKKLMKITPSSMLHSTIQSNYAEMTRMIARQEGVSIIGSRGNSNAVNVGEINAMLVDGKVFLENGKLAQEVFGPFSLVIQCENKNQLLGILNSLEGQLTGSIIACELELKNEPQLIEALQKKVGRMIFNGVPTGVEVCPSMTHGGPFPASSDSRFTAVGIHSIKRWVRPFSFQNWPQLLLPDELKDDNPKNILRLLNKECTRDKVK
jgi:2,5-dioxopentanoate dehydrogenase